MGKHFGNLQYLKGVTYYVLSPHELHPFRGVFNPGLKNTIRRTSESLIPFGLPIVIGFIVCSQLKEMNRKLKLKNPDDYINDV